MPVRGWLVLPVVLLVALLIGLPALALTETGIEKEVKGAVGFSLDDCDPAANLASPWLEGPALAEAVDEPRAVALGESIYLFGGTTSIEEIGEDLYRLESSDKAERFDPRTAQYEELAPMPRPLNHVSVTTYGGDIYLAGGYGSRIDVNTSRGFYRYQPALDRWTRLPDMPAPRAAGALDAVGDRLIYAGGSVDAEARAETFAYDFDSRGWSRLPSMHSRRDHVGEAVLGHKLYVLGGALNAFAVDTAERYDPRTERWEVLPRMPVPAGGLAAVAVDDGVLAVSGGDDAAGTVTGAVQEYRPSREEWQLLAETRVARHGHGAALANGEVWVFGGSKCAYFNPIDGVEHIPVEDLRAG